MENVAITNKKVKVALLSILSNSILVIGKTIIGILIGSVSIISEAIHSGMDLVASVIAFLAVKISGKPADKEHPFGHGKVENLSGFFEALLILIAASLIIYEAINKITHQEPMENISLGLIIMGVSAVLNIIVSHLLMKVAKQTDSIALEADALHLRADVYTSLGVFAGLGLIIITDFYIIDPIIAILVALFICKKAVELTIKSFNGLLDTCLSEEDISNIKKIISVEEKVLEYHKLRTRKSGSEKHIDFHLVVSDDFTVKESHDLCNKLEHKIKEIIPLSKIVIHVEPYSSIANKR